MITVATLEACLCVGLLYVYILVFSNQYCSSATLPIFNAIDKETNALAIFASVRGQVNMQH